VVLEEIKMDQDNPESVAHELLYQNFWSGHPLGRSILGTPETVSAFTRTKVQSWFEKCYAPNRLVITAAGHLTHSQLVELVAARFSNLERDEDSFTDPKPEATPHITLRSKSELEQVHLCLGVPALPLTDSRRFAVSVMNNILGGGMSSRLFQNIRERQGLAYSIFSDLSPYRDTGTLCVYAGTSAGKAVEVVDLILLEFRKLKEELLSTDELTRAKDQLKGNILMGLESSNSRMANLARQEMYFHQFFTVEEVIARIDQVDAEQVLAMAQKLFDSNRIAVTLLGRLDGIKLSRKRLVC